MSWFRRKTDWPDTKVQDDKCHVNTDSGDGFSLDSASLHVWMRARAGACFVCLTAETIVMLGGVTLWPIRMVNKTFIEAEECSGFLCVCLCMHVQTNVCAHVCVREGECVSLSLCLWCWPSRSDPTECTILSTNKGPAVPPNFNRGLLQHHQPFAAELTKYFPFWICINEWFCDLEVSTLGLWFWLWTP